MPGGPSRCRCRSRRPRAAPRRPEPSRGLRGDDGGGRHQLGVDTHFRRLTNRFGWVAEDDPVKIEFLVDDLIEKRDWTMLSHRVIFHGRRVCHARKPACGACTLATMCPSYGTGPTEAAAAARLLKGPRARELAVAAGVDPDLVPAAAIVTPEAP